MWYFFDSLGVQLLYIYIYMCVCVSGLYTVTVYVVYMDDIAVARL